MDFSHQQIQYLHFYFPIILFAYNFPQIYLFQTISSKMLKLFYLEQQKVLSHLLYNNISEFKFQQSSGLNYKFFLSFPHLMSQQTKQALLSWLSKVLHTQIHQTTQLRDGQFITQLCNKFPGINLNTNKQYEGWKDGYLKLKTVNQQITSFMKNVVRYEFPNALETINLVEMAKGHDDQGLISLLKIIFLVSFNLGPQSSQIFVEKAMAVSSQHQEELCDIVRNNPVPKYEQGQREQFEEKYEKQREKVTSLINAFQSLEKQAESLRESLIAQADDNKKLSDQLKKTEEQRDKLKRQLLQNYKVREQEDPRKNAIAQHHEQMVEMLKSSMVEQEQNYSQQIFQLKEKIETLEEQLDIYKNKVSELQENNFKGIVDHSSCISIDLYKKEKTQLSAKLTEASSKQWKTKLQNIRLQNLTQQLKEKNKKLLEDNKNKENTMTLSKSDANKLKLDFFVQIRDSLKKRLDANLMMSQQSNKKKQPQQNLHGIILDDPDIN